MFLQLLLLLLLLVVSSSENFGFSPSLDCHAGISLSPAPFQHLICFLKIERLLDCFTSLTVNFATVYCKGKYLACMQTIPGEGIREKT